jgi:hypothetical protein
MRDDRSQERASRRSEGTPEPREESMFAKRVSAANEIIDVLNHRKSKVRDKLDAIKDLQEYLDVTGVVEELSQWARGDKVANPKMPMKSEREAIHALGQAFDNPKVQTCLSALIKDGNPKLEHLTKMALNGELVDRRASSVPDTAVKAQKAKPASPEKPGVASELTGHFASLITAPKGKWQPHAQAIRKVPGWGSFLAEKINEADIEATAKVRVLQTLAGTKDRKAIDAAAAIANSETHPVVQGFAVKVIAKAADQGNGHAAHVWLDLSDELKAMAN